MTQTVTINGEPYTLQLTQPSCWEPTMHLRIVKPALDLSFLGGMDQRRWQQLWLDKQTGEQEWRDVPIVVEETPTT